MALKNEPLTSYLSKSLFIRGLQCHKSLWLQKNCPELKDEVSGEQEALFATGFKVGDLAKELFPGGVEVPYEDLTYNEQVDRTREAIDKGAVSIYEATFLHNCIFVKADILYRGKQGWELYEVKASTEVKDYHYYAVALQYHVLRGSGFELGKACIVHVNNSYVRKGDLNIRELFTIVDVTSEILDLQQRVSQEISSQRAMLLGDIPAIDIGPHCTDPYECDFTGCC